MLPNQNLMNTVVLFFYTKAASRGAHADSCWHAMHRKKERGRDERRWTEIQDFRLTPLWIFLNAVYYNTLALNTWNQDKKEKSKRGHAFFWLLALGSSSPLKGLEDDRMAKTEKRKNKETLWICQLVGERNHTTSHSTTLNHTDKDK